MLTFGAVDTVKFKRTWTEINNETVGFIVLIVSAGGKKINEIKIDPSWSTSLLCLFICRLNNLALFISLMQLPWIYWSSHKVVYQKPCNLETVYLQAWVKFYVDKCGWFGVRETRLSFMNSAGKGEPWRCLHCLHGYGSCWIRQSHPCSVQDHQQAPFFSLKCKSSVSQPTEY